MSILMVKYEYSESVPRFVMDYKSKKAVVNRLLTRKNHLKRGLILWMAASSS